MKKNTTVKPPRTSARWAVVGIDLGDRTCHAAVLDKNKQTLTEFPLPTTPAAFRAKFERRRPTLIVLEAGTHSHWSSHLLEELGHTVVVANPRQLALISHSTKKTDRADALTLARLGLSDLALLSPVTPRNPQQQLDLTCLRARAEFVAQRTGLLNSARSLVKPHGVRLPVRDACSRQSGLADSLPPELKATIEPMLAMIDRLSDAIRDYDRQLAAIATRYPETVKLRKIRGVGLIVALTYVLVIGDPKRFRRSRQVGCYTGTTPRRKDSGQRNPQLGITKHGDAYLRAMLTQSAQFILGPLGEDCDLRRWGLRLCERGGSNAKKRAVTAVARKLAVLMHRLWISDQPYDRFYNAPQTQTSAA